MADGSHESIESSAFLRGAGERVERISALWQDQVDTSVAGLLTPLRYQAGKIGAVKVRVCIASASRSQINPLAGVAVVKQIAASPPAYLTRIHR